jgi:hypothetical protein
LRHTLGCGLPDTVLLAIIAWRAADRPSLCQKILEA